MDPFKLPLLLEHAGRTQVRTAGCARARLSVSAYAGAFEGLRGLAPGEWRRATEEKKQIRVEIWRTLCGHGISFFSECPAFAWQMLPRCDDLETH